MLFHLSLLNSCFWDWLPFRNNTELKCLERAVSYRCAYYLPLDYRGGEDPALLLLIPPSEAKPLCSTLPNTVTSTDPYRQPQLPTELTM